MAKTAKTAPRRAGRRDVRIGRARAKRLARKAVSVLGDDPEALALVVAAVELIAKRARSRR